jgi:IclR family transcriptional regulator, acetate operon repressor
MAMERDPVGKALAVLLALSDEPEGPWSVRRMARELDTSPATVHRIFGTFEARHLLTRAPDGGYLPGVELFRLSRSLQDHYSPVGLARPYVRALAEQSDEAVLLAAYDSTRRELMIIDSVQPAHPLHYEIAMYRWLPVYAGATGLAILASLPPAERHAIYQAGLSKVTPATLVSEPDLEEACVRTREQGYALTVGQRVTGTVALAAPIFGARSTVFGVIGVAIPERRFDPARESALARGVIDAAASVTGALGEAGHRGG